MAVHSEVRDGGILWIVLDDPDAMNAMDAEAMAQLGAVWTRYRDDDSLHVAVITGAGERAFCVGSNLKTFIPQLQSGERDPRENQEAYLKGDAATLWKPIVAAVNGDCLGGGLEIMTGADIRISVPQAKFGLPEPRWGLFPGGGGTVRLPRQVPYPAAMELLLTGEPIGAEDALRIGLINRVVPSDQLESTTMALAGRIAGNGALALRRIKESVHRGLDLDLAAAYKLESDLGLEVFHAPEAAEGLAAFAEKRTPRFNDAG